MRARISYRLANYCGVFYTVGVIAGVVALVLIYVCPATYGEGRCGNEKVIAAVVVAELAANFYCFLKYSRYVNVEFV